MNHSERMQRKSFISLIIILVCYGQALAEIKNIGTPFIRNFTKGDYSAGTQSWGVAQDLKGFIYFANNDGLLVYDGVQWEVYRMPNLSMVRSVYIDYTGEVNAKFRGNTVQLSLESGAAGTYIW